MISEDLADIYIDAYNKKSKNRIGEIEDSADFSYKFGENKSDLGVVIGTKRNEKGELTVYQTANQHHVLINASTGFGKTQGYVLNTVFNLDGKTSMIILDPKGEITTLTYNRSINKYGKENVGILNLREPKNSELRYNPFQALAQEYYRTEKIASYSEKQEARERIAARLQVVINNIFTTRDMTDPSWEIGARELVYAIFMGLIEDTCEDSLKNSKSPIRRKISSGEVTIKTALNIFSRFSWTVDDNDDWGDFGFFYDRPDSSVAKQRAKSVLGTTAAGTRTSYLSLVNSFFEPYFNGKVLDITSDNTLDALKMAYTPRILYIVYDMVDEISKRLVNDITVNSLNLFTAEYAKTSKPLPVPVIFLCDEFNSLTPNNIYPNILSVGRGMNIYLHLIIQSLSQLRAAYKERADVIIENCGVKVFLGTNEYSTAKKFIEETGNSVKLSKESLMSGNISFVEKPMIDIEKILYGMKRGECFVKIINTPPIHSNFEMFYETPEYNVFPKFDLTSVVAPKIQKHDKITGIIDDIGKEEIEKARQELQKRKAEILKRISTVAEDDDL